MTPTPSPSFAQWQAARRAEARRIVLAGDAYTASQKAWAWATLTGMPPHLCAPRQPDRAPINNGDVA